MQFIKIISRSGIRRTLTVLHKKTFSQLSNVISAAEHKRLVNSIVQVSLLGENEDNKNSLSLLNTLYTAESLQDPYVTKVLEETKPIQNKIILQKWRMKMIKSMGAAKFQQHMNEILSSGKSFHRALEAYFESRDLEDIEIEPSISTYWKSVLPHLSDVGKVEMMEERICHPTLLYSGRVDCVATYKNVLCVIDWKTSRKPKPTLRDCYDEPFQVAAYIGAINAMGVLPTKITTGVLVKAYEDGTIAHAHKIDQRSMELYWFKFLRRLVTYHMENLQLSTRKIDQ